MTDILPLTETNEACPRCGNRLYAHALGYAPDDMITYLVCRVCKYCEKE